MPTTTTKKIENNLINCDSKKNKKLTVNTSPLIQQNLFQIDKSKVKFKKIKCFFFGI